MLTYSKRGPIAWAILDRPDRLNAMHREFWRELRELLALAEADPEVRVLVFRGEGRCFSVGGDIESFGEIGGPADRRAYMRAALGALRSVEEFSKPTIAAVHGHALGGGCELTLVCDIVIADETAQFGMPESQVGLVPGLAMARGAAQLNLHWLKFLVFTGEPIDAHEARIAGLVNRVTPAGEHLAEAGRVAAAVASRAPLALAVGKQLMRRHAPELYEHAIDAVGVLFGTEDFQRGLAAFEDRQTPAFEGR
jgi:enoyl-CoA hydratase/carnithine racemase